MLERVGKSDGISTRDHVTSRDVCICVQVDMCMFSIINVRAQALLGDAVDELPHDLMESVGVTLCVHACIC